MANLSNIDVVILCGGLGKRLRPAIGVTQKTMAQVNDEPFLNILMKSLQRQGFRRAVLCTGFEAEQVEQYYSQQNFGLQIEFSREDKPLGTGGAIKNARALIQSDPFIAMNGDSLCSLSFQKFIQYHKTKNSFATIAMAPVPKEEQRKEYGVILLDDQKRIISFQEKREATGTKQRFVNAGVYCFDRDVLSMMPQVPKFSLETDFFPKLPKPLHNRFLGFEVEDTFIDIGTPERYQQAQQLLRKES